MFELLQFTDLHITRTAGECLRGIDTRDSLDAVYRRALLRHPTPGALLLTGDIADDGSPEAYEHIREVFADAPCPVLAIPGNHDHPQTLCEVLSSAPFVTEGVHWLGEHWCAHLLDSHLPGAVGGRLTAASLALLEQARADDSGRHQLLALHHPPIALGSTWMDSIGLEDAHALLQVVEQTESVRAVVWGHAHQRYDGQRGGAHLLCTPSTCVQFAPRKAEFGTDNSRGPGYRHLRLHTNGKIETEVVWLPFNTGLRAIPA
ncbi:MAG: phosphodiesterase [Pseudomonadota bacterium]